MKYAKYILLVVLGSGIALIIITTIFMINTQNYNNVDPYNDKSNKQEEVISSEFTVEIAGAVIKPGVYKMHNSAKLIDLLETANGLKKEADHNWIQQKLNLAQSLKDENKYYFPFEWDTVYSCNFDINLTEDAGDYKFKTSNKIDENTTDQNENNNNLININIADISALKDLPGIGDAYGNKIISNRTYDNYSQLVSKSGIPENTLLKIKDLIKYE